MTEADSQSTPHPGETQHEASGPACSLDVEGPREDTPQGECRPKRRFWPMAATFGLMMLTWLVLSNMRDLMHITMGVIASALVAYYSWDMLFPPGGVANRSAMRAWLRFPAYIPWLLWEIWKANLWVLYLCFHPRLRELINPQVIRFKSSLKSRMAVVTFANSITLTPGTITVDVDWDGTFTVHALDRKSAESLPGEMERKVAHVYSEV